MLIRPMRDSDVEAAYEVSYQAMEGVRATTRPASSVAPPRLSSSTHSDGAMAPGGAGTRVAGATAMAPRATATAAGGTATTGSATATTGSATATEAGARTGDGNWRAAWSRRTRHILEHDPGGCWVADVDGEVVGFATSLRREKLWGLSSYFVHPKHQGAGIGAALLQPVLGYSQGCLRGIIISTGDPRAARRYRLAGFSLHPTIRVSGVVDRTSIPVVDGVRVGGLGDRDLCDSVDRRTRGAAHGVDHEYLCAEFDLLVCDTLTGSGYCYSSSGTPILLAATNRRVAQRLLWSALARSPEDATVAVNFMTAAQEWAVDVCLAARLSLRTDGYLCLRHMRPPSPYLPSGAFL